MTQIDPDCYWDAQTQSYRVSAHEGVSTFQNTLDDCHIIVSRDKYDFHVVLIEDGATVIKRISFKTLEKMKRLLKKDDG